MSPLPHTFANGRSWLIVQSGFEVCLKHLTTERGLFVLWQTGLLSICLRSWKAGACHRMERSSAFYPIRTSRVYVSLSISLFRRLPLWRSMTAFQSTRQLIHRILVATAIPHSAVFLALWYIFRLPISPQTVVYAQDTARARFRDSLKNGSAYLIEDYMMRVFTAGIMLADKWVNDQTFQLRTWYAILLHFSLYFTNTPLKARDYWHPQSCLAQSRSCCYGRSGI
jgi:hypothetical protein